MYLRHKCVVWIEENHRGLYNSLLKILNAHFITCGCHRFGLFAAENQVGFSDGFTKKAYMLKAVA